MSLEEILTELERRSSVARYIPHLVRLARAGEDVYRCLEGTPGEHAEGVCDAYCAAVKALEESYDK